MRIAEITIAGLLAAGLAGCADIAERQLALAPDAPATLARAVPPEAALAMLPAEAGAVVSVSEQREEERLRQTVTLAGAATARGSNEIRIVAERRGPSTTRRVTEAQIDAELAAELPGIDMRPTSRVIVNAAGPIGVATGRARDGSECAYGWQETAAAPRRGAPHEGLGALFAETDRTDLSIRVRLCRKGVSQEQLIAAIEGLSLRAGVASRRGSFATGSIVGGDALTSAGYGGRAVAAPIAVAPRATVATAPRRVAPLPAARVAAVPKPSTEAAAAKPVSRVPEVAAKASPGITDVAPTIVANPIPLPSGG